MANPLLALVPGETKSIPAPVGGWNARDAESAMPETDAVQMINAFPNTTDVQARLGAEDHVTGITGKDVQTLVAYNSATSKLFAFVDNAIYNVTSPGSVGSAESGTTITNGKFQCVAHKVPGGNQYLIAVNGVDDPHYYDGTNWAKIDELTTPALTGFTGDNVHNLIHVHTHQRRLWFIAKDTTEAWYLAIDAVGGALTRFDVGGLLTKGGFLMAMASWTLDAGKGSDDHAVFISSKGEVVVYQGTDPASASAWGLVGVYDIGSPIGRRCVMKLAGDLGIITQAGVVPLSKAMQSSQLTQGIAITDKIRDVMTSSVKSFQANFGWQLLQYPNGNMIFVNVPISATESEQYVMNTITGSWCRFTNWNAFCWELFNDEIYYGADAKVVKAWTLNADFGKNIVADIVPAFSYFDGGYEQKFWNLARPVMKATGSPSILMDINVDFEIVAPAGAASLPAAMGFFWDIDNWDEGVWGGAFAIYKDWQAVSGIGFAGALHLKIISKDHTVKWLSTDYQFERGAAI